MALPEPTTLASIAWLIVSLLALVMAVLGLRSYRNTGNLRLMFVVVAFGVFVIKGLFAAYDVRTHAVPHDSIEFVLALFDMIIVALLFVPFVLPVAKP